MKLITLNTWAGKLKEPFDNFLRERMSDTDIFCFQEVFNNYSEGSEDYLNDEGGNTNILNDISNILTDYDAHFCLVAENVYGIAIFLSYDGLR